VDAIQTIYTSDQPLDLNRVEILTLMRRTAFDSRFVRGLVLDHGGRHPDMPKVLYNVHIMICNVSLEYEQTETAAGFVYRTAEEREALVESERKWLDERCRKIIHFKRSVCTKEGDSFCIINQKGVDPLSLDIFAKEGILCLRRAKRRNMERLSLACGGTPILSLEDLDRSQLGYAGKVSEETYGEDKYTFVEDCGSMAQACTMLLTTDQMKDAVKDGLRAVKNTVEDQAIVPGGGAFEIAASIHLQENIVPKAVGKLKLGIMAYAEALLIIPKTLIGNSGYDIQEVLLQLKEEYINAGRTIPIGVNCRTGTPMVPEQEGIYDNVRVKRQSLYLSTVLANQLLLVDEVMKAGKQMGKQPPPPEEMQ
jgi:T-complex protein 1 subunit zeta